MRKEHIYKILLISLAGLAVYLAHLFSTGGIPQRGLYVHIRAADKAFEKGRYQEAFSSLQKAYEASPRTQTLRDRMIYGYIRYASHIAEERSVEEAVRVLKPLHREWPDNDMVLRALSFLEARSAWEHISRGDEAQAEVIMDGVLRRVLASPSGGLRLGLSNFLFNSGADAFASGDWPAARLALESSQELWSRADTLLALARLEHRVNDLNASRARLKEALILRPDDSAISEELSRVELQMGIESDMELIQAGRFEVRFHDGAFQLEQEDVIRAFDDVRRRIELELGFSPPERTRVVVYRREDFQNAFPRGGHVRAFYDGAIRMQLGDARREENLKTIIAHEYTHAVIDMKTGGNCPLWIHEGLAVYHQSVYEPVSTALLEEELDRGEDLTVSWIEETLSRHQGGEEELLAYQAAYSIIVHMIERWGLASLRAMLDKLSEGAHYANALDEVYFISLRELERSWRVDL